MKSEYRAHQRKRKNTKHCIRINSRDFLHLSVKENFALSVAARP